MASMNDKGNKKYFGYIIYSKTCFEPNFILKTLFIWKNDIRTLVDVVIIDSMGVKFF